MATGYLILFVTVGMFWITLLTFDKVRTPNTRKGKFIAIALLIISIYIVFKVELLMIVKYAG